MQYLVVDIGVCPGGNFKIKGPFDHEWGFRYTQRVSGPGFAPHFRKDWGIGWYGEWFIINFADDGVQTEHKIILKFKDRNVNGGYEPSPDSTISNVVLSYTDNDTEGFPRPRHDPNHH